VNVKTNAHIKANSIECVNPRCPKGCKYGIPKRKLIISKSGKMVEKTAAKSSHLVLFASITFVKV
jgi:hypothetical protein